MINQKYFSDAQKEFLFIMIVLSNESGIPFELSSKWVFDFADAHPDILNLKAISETAPTWEDASGKYKKFKKNFRDLTYDDMFHPVIPI